MKAPSWWSRIAISTRRCTNCWWKAAGSRAACSARTGRGPGIEHSQEARARRVCAGGDPRAREGEGLRPIPLQHPRRPLARDARAASEGDVPDRREWKREIDRRGSYRHRGGLQRRGWKQELQLRVAPIGVRAAHGNPTGAWHTETEDGVLPACGELLQRGDGNRAPR